MARTGMLKLATAALAAAALTPAAAAAAPAVDGTFDLPGRPAHLTLGPDGNVWVALESATADFAKVEPDGRVTGYDSPQVLNPKGIDASLDGRLWVTQIGGVAHFTPADPVGARSVPIVGINDPRGIALGHDGNLWTASSDQVYRIADDDGRFTSFRVDGMGARGIAAGADRNMYIADFGGQRVVGLTTAGVVARTYRANGGPQEVAAGPGNQIAFSDPTAVPQQLGRFTTPDGPVLTTDVQGTDPFGIVFAVDDAYWAANFATSTLSRMTPDGSVTTLTGLPGASGPRYLTQGAGSTLWVGLESARKVARVTGVVAPPAGGGGGGQGADTTAPALSRLALARRLRLGRAGGLRVTLSEAATLTLRFERKLPGRRKAGRCVKPRRAPKAKRCARYVKRGVQLRSVQQGANRERVGGRIGRRVLPVGRYRVTIVAKDAAGNVSKPAKRTLRIVAPRRR